MPRRNRRAAASVVCAAALLLALACDCAAATRYDWRLRFKTLRTPHFDIHAHQGVEALAERLAAIAEDVWKEMQPVLGVPRGRVQVILVDQTDISNGWATPFPYDAIEIAALSPPAESSIGNTTEWLRLVFTHEYTHILHLDRTGGWIRGIRGIFGRVPVAFPNAFLPIWQIEGIATFEESRMTHEGRVPAGDFRAIVEAAARARRFDPHDRASGGLIDWPGGTAAYAYGAYFHQYLADQYGAARIRDLADATAGRFPFFGAPAFKRVFGKPVGDLWKEFAEVQGASASAPGATDASATRLTHHGFNVFAPRFAPDGSIYYALADAHRFPSLMKRTPEGTIARVTPRIVGNRTSVRGGWIVFDQVDRVRSVALYSDLYATKIGAGAVRRLTVGARAADPDLSPDGKQIACTVHRDGRRALGLLNFAPDAKVVPEVIVDEAGSDFSGPRWSPDGRQLVAERRRLGVYELVLVDVDKRAVRPLVSGPTRLATPSWLPDGSGILFAAAIEKRPFDIYAVSLDGTIRRVTTSTSGAQSPELSPDGGTLLYVGYTAEGFDLFSIPANRASWRVVQWTSTRSPARADTKSSGSLGAYSPWRTLAPTYWTPTLATDADELLIGASTAMTDALGRHSYAVDAAWAGRLRPDWHAAYAYDRWWPTIFAGYSDDTDPISVGLVRSREGIAGVLLPFRRIRWSETLLGAIDVQRDRVQCDVPCDIRVAEGRRSSLRGGWIHDSRREFGYSISSEEGIQVEAAFESTREALGSDGDGGAAVFDARAFQRVAGHAVLAGRAAFAGAWGDPAVRRAFAAGGPGPSVAFFDFGRDTIALVRGFHSDDLVGTRAAVVNVDLRFPLAYPQRGPGSWPIFFQSFHAAVFGDAGNAWDRRFRVADVRVSAGAELSSTIVLGHFLPLTFTAGAAWTRDPVSDRSRGAIFGRIGRAF